MKINKNSLLKLASISLTLVLFVVSAQGQGECAPGQYWGAARVINNPLVCGSSPAGVCRGIASKQNAQDNPDYSYRMQEYWFSTVHNNGVCHIRNFPPEGPGNGYSEGMASSDVNHFLDASDGLFAVDDQQDNGMSCPSEGNPINPANGNKFQTELDYRSGGSDALKFIRTYNSASDINAEMGSNWVHNYHRRVSVRNKFAVGHIPNNPYHSPKYTDNVQACESGWNFVKDSLPDGIGDNAYAVYVSSASFDGTCQIKSSDNHDIIGSLPIRNVVSLAVEPDLLDSVSITRPDGKSYYFKYLGYTSNSTPHFSSQNTRATLSEVFVYDAQLNETVELKLVDEDDNIEIYDTNYRLKSIETRSGYKTTFEYDGSDRLERVTNHHGLELNIAYDANDRIDYVTDPAGQTIQYGYTGDNLTSVTYQNGESKTYIYDDSSHPNALKGILNERGHRVSSWEYDSEGRAYISYNGPMLDPVGRIELNFISSIETEVTDSAMAKRTYHYSLDLNGAKRLTKSTGDACQTCGSAGAEILYDNNGFVREMTDYGGNITSYDYDEMGRQESRTEGLNTTEQRVISTTWEGEYRVSDTITEESVFASQDRTTDHEYNDFGWLKKTTVSGFSHDGAPVSRETKYFYRSEEEGDFAQIDYIDGPRTDVDDFTTFTYYDSCEFGTVCGRLDQIHTIENADGHVTEILTYDSHSRIESWKDANDLETKYTYDLRGRVDLVELIPPVASGLATRTIDYEYYENGLVDTVDTPGSGIMKFWYDTAEQLTKVTDPFGNELVLDYDSRGNLTNQKIYNGSEMDMPVDLRYSVDAVFDLLGQLSALNNDFYSEGFEIDADGNLRKYTDGRSTEQFPIETIYTYDSLNRLKTIEDAFNGPTALTDLGYDAQDRITSLTTPTGVETQYKYDDLGNLRTEISPDRGTTTYVPDDAGNIKTETNAEGKLALFTYDSLNRVKNIAYSTPPNSPTLNIQYIYDYDGGPSSPNGIGRLTKMIDESGVTTYDYNAFGQLVLETKNYTGQPSVEQVTIGYGYDSGGNLETMTYPSGRIVTFGRDGLGRISSITADFSGDQLPATSILTSAAYEPFGPAKMLTYGNGIIEDRLFDSQFRLTQKTLSAGAMVLFDYDYKFDLSSNVENRKDLNNTLDESVFFYDELNRLDIATNSSTFGSLDYDYDGNGNRDKLVYDAIEVNTVTEMDPIASNRIDRLTDANDVTLIDYTVDLAGRTTIKDEIGVFKWEYEYNDAGRLWKVHSDEPGMLTEIVSYTYNGLGQRASKTIAGGEPPLYFVYTTAGQLIAELDAHGIPVAEYVYFNNEPVAVLGSDRDGDGHLDTDDNCIAHANADQRDTNGDGFGNRCDPDLNNDGIINFLDLGLLANSPNWGGACGDYETCDEDFNGDGNVNFLDFPTYTSMFQQPPGPRGAGYGAPNSGTLWIHNDHLGTPIRLTNDQATVVWSSNVRPFGSASVSGSTASSLIDENPDGGTPTVFNLRMPGQYYDSETGLSYNYYRTYDPSTGRYITSDPIGLAGGLNTYGYALQNPIMLYDPYGLWVPPSLPSSVVDFTAGFGDGLSGGLTAWFRDQAGIDGGVDKCSSAYSGSRTTGNVASLTLGGGRLVYAGLAKGYSITASSGAAASAGRSRLRRLFGGGGSLRPPNLSRYPNDAALRAAAGRTNPFVNATGAGVGGLGAYDLANGDECECGQ